MQVQSARTETGTKVKAKGTSREALICGVITRCQPDGFSLFLFEALPEGDTPRGYCHIPAWRLEPTTVAQLEEAARRWVADGVIPPACLPHGLV
jgi:hypothetical protein